MYEVGCRIKLKTLQKLLNEKIIEKDCYSYIIIKSRLFIHKDMLCFLGKSYIIKEHRVKFYKLENISFWNWDEELFEESEAEQLEFNFKG